MNEDNRWIFLYDSITGIIFTAIDYVGRIEPRFSSLYCNIMQIDGNGSVDAQYISSTFVHFSCSLLFSVFWFYVSRSIHFYTCPSAKLSLSSKSRTIYISLSLMRFPLLPLSSSFPLLHFLSSSPVSFLFGLCMEIPSPFDWSGAV